ncbi:hypothetical protein [Bradyrhizobium sp.]|uniref:hypothetical protein n=1 Tax=Bradyrhizobium sp. TaxID=376 RepID=UPI002611B945|nr:hypothetical protein [Bradyrhizobium sp.]
MEGHPLNKSERGNTLMTQTEFATGSAIFLVVIVAGLFASVRVERNKWNHRRTGAGRLIRLRHRRWLLEELALAERADAFAEM